MSFLNSALLAGLLPLVALPLIIHLLNKQFPTLFRFSSVKNIRDTAAERSKLFKLRHIIFMLLRTAFLILLLFAFLKPVLNQFGFNAAENSERSVLVLIDHSLSMEYKGESVSCRERALHEAEKLIDTLEPDDELNIFLVAQTPTSCFVDFSRNHDEAKRFLKSVKGGFTRADFNQANAAVARTLSKVKGRSEVYYFSDFQRKNWANVDFSALPPTARIFFRDVGTVKKDNRAILSATVEESQFLAGDSIALQVTVGNFSEQAFNGPLSAIVDDRLSFEQTVEIAPWTTARITLPIPAGSPGLHRCELRLPEDDLLADNRFFISIPVLEKEEVLLVSDDSEEKGAVYFLKTALNPFDDKGGSLLPVHIQSSELSATRMVGVRKVFLTRAGKLSEEACAQLAKLMFSGGGVIYFLDGKNDAENLIALDKAMGSGVVPMKLGLRHVAENIATGAQQVSKGDFKSRYLKLFRGATRQDLGLLEFYDFYQASSTGAGEILLHYSDETPAMASASHGLGTMLLLNFSAGELSSNLARQKIFPAWVQELVKALSTEESIPLSHAAGENVSAEVWRHELRQSVLMSPDGTAIPLKSEAMGERYAVSFTPYKPGFYTMGAGKERRDFAVNHSPDESDLRAIEKSMLPEQMKGEQQANFIQSQDDFNALAAGRPLFHYFIYAALLFLLLEAGFQLWIRRLSA
ncbi:MAG: BatA domain-containing protein [Verrucomicrobia bacterium]|nr:BatA domain-containing protein [Verrucomicrobiota bacterium]